MSVWRPLLFEYKIKYIAIIGVRYQVPRGTTGSNAFFVLFSLKSNINCRSPPPIDFVFRNWLEDILWKKNDQRG